MRYELEHKTEMWFGNRPTWPSCVKCRHKCLLVYRAFITETNKVSIVNAKNKECVCRKISFSSVPSEDASVTSFEYLRLHFSQTNKIQKTHCRFVHLPNILWVNVQTNWRQIEINDVVLAYQTLLKPWLVSSWTVKISLKRGLLIFWLKTRSVKRVYDITVCA